MRPPIRFDVSQKTILGVSYRAIAIMAIAIGLALGAVGGLRDLPLFARAGLAVLSISLGLALAFGEINGKTLEAWLWDLLAFRRRTRFLLHRAVRVHGEGQVGWAPIEQPREAPPVVASAVASTAPSFFILSANAIGLSMIACLSIWLIQGGAHQLTVILKPF